MSAEPFIAVLIGPGGVGKGTLARRLVDADDRLWLSKSWTTRPVRATEDGTEYHFVDRATFERAIDNDEFLEWAEFHGNLYGTSKKEVHAAESDPACGGLIFDIDYQGARQIRAKVHDASGVFILPPSMEVLEKRLRGRASDTEEVIQRRFQAARREIDHYALFDYLIVNDDLDVSVATLAAIVARQAAEGGPPISVTISVAFGCPFAGEVSQDQVIAIAREAARLGVREIALADTIGVADPWTVRARISATRVAAPDARLRLHFHDTRGTGLANAFAGVEAGVETVLVLSGVTQRHEIARFAYQPSHVVDSIADLIDQL